MSRRYLFVCVENSCRSQMAKAFARMGCGDACPMVSARQRLDWEIPDPKHMEMDGFRKVRDLIGKKVRALLGQTDP